MKVFVPESLSELTLERYANLMAVPENDPERGVKLLVAFLAITEKEARGMDLESVQRVMPYLYKLMDADQQDYGLQKLIAIDGVEYGFHPNMSNITVGEFVDLEYLCKDLNANMTQFLSVVYRPLKTKGNGTYSIKSYRGVKEHEHFKTVTMDVVMGVLNFFLHIGLNLSSVMPKSSSPQEEVAP